MVDINAKVAATVQALLVKEGQDVIAGQVLVKLASSDLELTRLESLYALSGEARINVDAARQRLEAAQRSADNLALALRDARAAGRLSTKIAQRNLTDAQQDLKRTAAKLENLIVKTPFAGRVVALPIRVGQDIAVSAKLLTLADLSQLIV